MQSSDTIWLQMCEFSEQQELARAAVLQPNYQSTSCYAKLSQTVSKLLLGSFIA